MDEPALRLVAGQVSHDTRREVRHLDTAGVEQAAQNLERKIEKMRITVFQPMDLGEKFKKC